MPKVNERTGKIAYGFATNPRATLPNAAHISFTGTPIDKTDANAWTVFGD